MRGINIIYAPLCEELAKEIRRTVSRALRQLPPDQALIWLNNQAIDLGEGFRELSKLPPTPAETKD